MMRASKKEGKREVVRGAYSASLDCKQLVAFSLFLVCCAAWEKRGSFVFTNNCQQIKCANFQNTKIADTFFSSLLDFNAIRTQTHTHITHKRTLVTLLMLFDIDKSCTERMKDKQVSKRTNEWVSERVNDRSSNTNSSVTNYVKIKRNTNTFMHTCGHEIMR